MTAAKSAKIEENAKVEDELATPRLLLGGGPTGSTGATWTLVNRSKRYNVRESTRARDVNANAIHSGDIIEAKDSAKGCSVEALCGWGDHIIEPPSAEV